jgi:hypothetical protein
MNRRTMLTLTSMAPLFLAAVLATAVPDIGLAQSSPLIGTWKLNLAKSKYMGVPAPRSQTLTYALEGQNITATADAVDAQGQTVKTVFLHIYDGKPHPTTGVAGGLYDASSYTRVDANTVNFARLKDGKAVQTGWGAVSGDGKTYTVTTGGTGPNGQAMSTVAVFEKQ